MNNPLHILQTLDRHLTAPAEITLFGRAALALGYAGSPATFATTHDVDAILPLAWIAAENQNLDFWQAQQQTNAELENEGLYITHLFREVEIILTPDWLPRRMRVSLELQRLTVFRKTVRRWSSSETRMRRGSQSGVRMISTSRKRWVM